MKSGFFLPALVIFSAFYVSRETQGNDWITEKHPAYNLFYTQNDRENKKDYVKLFDAGLHSVKDFFNSPYNKRFDIYIHPHRHSLDSSWQKDWNMPGFKSECWMVASGVAARLDIISPVQWAKEACEHVYSATSKSQQLITHELVHVFHGQRNASPDFSNTEGIDWFVEGLATYASGQFDSLRISEVKKAISENKVPDQLDNFWTGRLRYGLSGSVVMFIDRKYGRATLISLLPLTKKSGILSALKTTEPELLTEWRNYFKN